jgi:hypothetical protein
MSNKIDLNLRTALNQLFNAGITEEQLKDVDVVVLPEAFGDVGQDLLDAQDAITFSKLLKQNNVRCANSYDLGLDVPTLERRSNDIWLGHVYILNDIILSGVVGTLGSMLSAVIMDNLKKKKENKNAPAGAVHTELTITRPSGVTRFNYAGDPETLVKIMEALKDESNEQAGTTV